MSHLGNLSSKNHKNVIFSYINIHSVRNKFDSLCIIAKNNVDVLSMAETKLDSLFISDCTILNWVSWAFEVGYKSMKWWTSCLYKGFIAVKNFDKV